MKIYKITKGNFALENTRDIRPHENNLRFHIQIEGKYYEYAIDTINKKTLNVRCVILLTFNNPDSTTNCCESINSGLNKDCPPLRTTNSVFNKVLKHKQGFLNKYSYVVELDHLSLVRRPKKQTEQYETLLELCESFDNFSESERKLNLFKYLGLFSRRDAIPDQYYEDPDDPESVLPENLENPK